ncbi:MAG TPA: hypothetical protein PLD47_02820 [Aggregatilineales bacterium]|nr:hypothetical protein [Anaerolineales bacterium]HRE46633.1 hypothetical protein [Aggregatilineales bacterium]
MAFWRARRRWGDLADLWAFDPLAGEWLIHTGETAPPLRSSHAAIWDVAHGQMILFGGVNKNGDLNDLWVYRPPSVE